TITLICFAACLLFTQRLSAQQACTGGRTDVSSMNSNKRGQLRDAIIAYLRSATDPTKASTSLMYYKHPAHHMMHFTQVHHQHTTIFFTWHRYYIQEMEHWFVENGYEQFVPLPSW